MRLRGKIEITWECDFETLKKEFGIPSTVSFEEANKEIQNQMLQPSHNFDKLEVKVELTKL